MPFDLEGARKAGYSDAEIADFLGADKKFDVPGARKAGYSDAEIIEHFGTPTGILSSNPPKPTLGQSFVRGLGLGTRDAIEGVGQLPGMLYDAARLPGQLITKGINALAPTQQSLSGMVTGQAPKPAWQIPEGYSSKDVLTGTADALGLPNPETQGERLSGDVGRNVASLIPSMGMGAAIKGMGKTGELLGNALASAPWSQILGAGGAGYAGGLAREAELGPAAQFGASLAGGITGAAVPGALSLTGRALSSAIQPFRQGGRESIVAEALLRNSSDPETLATRLRAGADDAEARLPGSPVTSAIAARDPQMLVLENGLRSDAQAAGGMSPAAAIRDVEAQRNANRLSVVEALVKQQSDPTARGMTLRDALGFGKGAEGAKQAMDARTNQLYGAIPKDNKVPLAPLVEELADIEKTYFGTLSGGMPAPLRAVADDIKGLMRGTAGRTGAPPNIPGMSNAPLINPPAPVPRNAVTEVDWQALQNLRSRVGAIGGEAAQAGNAPVAAAAKRLTGVIDNLGTSPEWQAATAQRSAVGQALERNAQGISATGQIMNRDQWGNPIMAADKVPNTAIASPGAARQVLGAFDKAVTDATAAGLPAERIAVLQQQAQTARQTLRDQFAENMNRAASTTSTVADAQGNTATQLSSAQFSRWWEKNRATADVLFDGAERKTLDRLAADFAETTLTNQGRARGSDTAQNLSVGNFIARLTGGVMDPQNPLAQSLVKLGPVSRWLYQSSDDAMRQMMVQAVRDPKFAAQLIDKASPASLERAVLYMNDARMRDAAVGALAREVPRGLGATNQDQRQLPRPTGR